MSVTARERILLIGASGAGKSFAWLTAARRLPDAKFHCIDTDDSVPRMLAGKRFAELAAADGGNVTFAAVRDWDTLQEATDAALAEVEIGDWLVIDRTDPAWDWVQAWFAEQVYGEDRTDYIMKRRMELAEKGKDRPPIVGEFGQGDWTTMNRVYDAWFHKLIYGCPAHLILTVAPKAIYNLDSMDPDTAKMFAPYGFQPGGRKGMAHYAHTVIMLGQRPHVGTHMMDGDELPGSWEATTIKDRERPRWTDHVLRDFGLEYVRRHARGGA